MRRRLILPAVAVAASLALVACGDDADEQASGEQPVTATTAPADSGDRGDTGDAAVVEVTAVDFAFEGLPDTVPVGTRLALANDAPAELHELVAFLLPEDETRSAHELMSLPEAELGPLLNAAPPATVLMAAPGGEQINAVGDGTLTQPGRYLIMCAIPSGVAPDAYLKAVAEAGGAKPDVEGGPPHFVHGMVTELVVE